MMNIRGTHAARISADQWLGACGCSLAVAAATFGAYMTIHGPSASQATSHDFTIFAQLAPRANEATRTHGPSKIDDDLDTSATASIPKVESTVTSSEGSNAPGIAQRVLPGIILQAADRETAEVAIDGHRRTVKVGDTIPGAGEVLVILPGPRPLLKTSLGMIVPAR